MHSTDLRMFSRFEALKPTSLKSTRTPTSLNERGAGEYWGVARELHDLLLGYGSALKTGNEGQRIELKKQVLGLKPTTKGWRQTVGMLPDDELSRSAEKLGREWRQQANRE